MEVVRKGSSKLQNGNMDFFEGTLTCSGNFENGPGIELLTIILFLNEVMIIE